MKEIKLLKRTFVKKMGVCEEGKKTVCDDKTAAYLVKTEHAEYCEKQDKKEAENTK
ncbi:hypothetical protein N9Y67_00030 [Pseudomonadota bacterium]|nr:hypothetical protein [Pseudomonadota bacterium]